MPSYQKLCTEFYNITKPWIGQKELAFYEPFLKGQTGPVLEPMCGSGRVLIPFLEKGYTIDGVDNSDEMLASCIQRCKDKKIHLPNLFNQSLASLQLPTKYSLIFIPYGSFQLIGDTNEAFLSLQKLHEHLEDNGTLLLETFVPWGIIRNCIYEQQLTEHSTRSFERKVTSPQGYEIIFEGIETTYPKQQKTIIEGRYKKIVHNNAEEIESEQTVIRWYYQNEMALLLEKAGFSVIQIHERQFEIDPYAVIFQAIKY